MDERARTQARDVAARLALLAALPIITVAVAAAVTPADPDARGMHLIAIWLLALLVAPLAAVGVAWDAGRAVPDGLERILVGAAVGAFGFGLGPVLGAQAFLVWVEDFVDDWTASAAGAVPELLVLGALVGSVMAALAPRAAEGLRKGP